MRRTQRVRRYACTREKERHCEGQKRRKDDEKEDDEEGKEMTRGGETPARNFGHLNVSEAVSSAKFVFDG